MKRIRLQVQIMPYVGPGAASIAAPTRQDADLKWCQPCTEDITIQDLADRITAKWARLCAGYGPLNIKYLKTIHGDMLDMEDTVGAIFDDRADFSGKISPNEVLPTSVVQVYRSPPDPQESSHMQRFGSLMPESSARPRKRPLSISVQDPPNSRYVMASVEGCDGPQLNGISSAPNKRQRTHEAHVNGHISLDQRVRSVGDQAEALHQLSQGSGSQGSVHQVMDSQMSPRRNQPNPYGTPSSLSLVSPQELHPWGHPQIASVPDSPTSRVLTIDDKGYATIANPGREITKSESPELGLSLHEVPPMDSERAPTQQNPEPEALQSSQMSQVIANSSPARPATPTPDEQLEVNGSGVQLGMGPSLQTYHIPPRRAPAPSSLIFGPTTQINGTHRYSEDIYDEIESDSESFHEKQQMHSAKHAKLERTTPGRLSTTSAPNTLTKDRRDGPFLVPDIPASRDSGMRASSGGSQKLQQRPDARSLAREKASSTAQHNDYISEPHIRPYPDPAQFPPARCGQNLEQAEINDEGAADGDSQHEAEFSAEAAITSSKAPDALVKNWSDLDIDHPVKQALSQGRKPYFSPPVSPEMHGDAEAEHENLPQNESEGSQENSMLSDQRAGHRRLSSEIVEQQKGSKTEQEAGPVAEQEASKDTGEERTLSHESSQEASSGHEQLQEAAKAKSTRSKGANSASASIVKHAPFMEPLDFSKIKDDEKVCRGRQAKEDALSKIAEQKKRLEESAEQLRKEKVEKQKISTSSGPNTTASKAPGVTKSRPRTEEEKARRRERDAQKRAQQAKALEPKQTQAERAKLLGPNLQLSNDWANQLFHSRSDAVPQDKEQIDRVSKKGILLKESVMARSSDQSVKVPKTTSAEPVHRSSTPSGLSNPAQKRRSLTPALPNTSVAKSPSNKGSLVSSSPLASRSCATLETPLRSALKQTPHSSTLRRSVSFLDDEGDNHSSSKDITYLKAPVMQAKQIKDMYDINNELAFTRAPSSGASRESSDGENTRSKTGSEPSAKKGMVQQKLNVTRDKKLKARAMGPPLPPSKEAPKQEEKTPSSDECSSRESSSDEDLGNENAKAGPSSRKKPPRVANPKQILRVKEHPSGTPIDPILENISSTRPTQSCPLPDRSSKSPSRTSNQPRSISRSPARRISETASVSSSSDSDSCSESGYGSDESGKETGSLASESSAGSGRSGSPQTNGIKKPTKATEPHPKGNKDLSKSTLPSNRQDTQDHNKHVEQQSSQLSKKPHAIEHKITDGIKKSNTTINDHPPENAQHTFRYPTLTMQRKMAKARTAEEEASALASSQKSTTRPIQGDESSSSSEEQSSSESAEDDDDDDEKAVSPSNSRTSSQTKSNVFPGLRGVMKIARKVSGR